MEASLQNRDTVVGVINRMKTVLNAKGLDPAVKRKVPTVAATLAHFLVRGDESLNEETADVLLSIVRNCREAFEADQLSHSKLVRTCEHALKRKRGASDFLAKIRELHKELLSIREINVEGDGNELSPGAGNEARDMTSPRSPRGPAVTAVVRLPKLRPVTEELSADEKREMQKLLVKEPGVVASFIEAFEYQQKGQDKNNAARALERRYVAVVRLYLPAPGPRRDHLYRRLGKITSIDGITGKIVACRSDTGQHIDTTPCTGVSRLHSVEPEEWQSREIISRDLVQPQEHEVPAYPSDIDAVDGSREAPPSPTSATKDGPAKAFSFFSSRMALIGGSRVLGDGKLMPAPDDPQVVNRLRDLKKRKQDEKGSKQSVLQRVKKIISPTKTS
eukprot:GHVU01221277.1.p1 GENE.GHVU01221277.1~~GHVU01221277.1.p1  ORF type:complete len:390 (+),score=36.24 GHVU01221277.1:205-1374(+)